MTLAFQESLLKYLFQNPEAKKYNSYLDESVFDSTWQVIFKLWKEYVKKYKTVPSKANFLEYFEREWEESKNAMATPELKKILLNDIALFYSPLEGDTVFIKEMIIDFAQKKLTRRLFTKNADKIANGSDKFFQSLNKEMTKIVALRNDDEERAQNRGHLYISEEDTENRQKIVAMPTPWYSLNKMTSAGGFYAPQLIVFMKGPKAFGTGLMLKMAAWDLIQGKKVFYADTENGTQDIYTRLDMTLLGCEEHEVKLYRYELKKIKAEIAKRGGEFICIHFPGGLATMQDMDDELTELQDQRGIKFDSCYNDYIDKFVPVDKSIKDTRLKIRNVYEHQMRLNSKWKFPCFTISPITSEATDKAFYTIKDFGEDKYKPYNCHASFALCCTDDEFKNGTMRIIPVVQRKGTGFMHNAATTCALKVDRKTGAIEELDSETYLAVMDVYATPEKQGKSKGKLIKMDKIVDE